MCANHCGFWWGMKMHEWNGKLIGGGDVMPCHGPPYGWVEDLDRLFWTNVERKLTLVGFFNRKKIFEYNIVILHASPIRYKSFFSHNKNDYKFFSDMSLLKTF